MWGQFGLARLVALLCAAAIAVGASGGISFAQQDEPVLSPGELVDPYPLRPPGTASPRETLQSFLTHGREAVRRYRASGSGVAVDRSKARALRCLDLTQIAPAARDDVGTERTVLLLELLDRLELPPAEEIPGVEEVEEAGLTRWTIPNTEITISRTPEGPYAGEFQFDALTVNQLPTFYERAKHLPNRSGALVGIYEDLIYLPGPWLPLELTTNLPELAYVVVNDQTVWQWVAGLATLALSAVAIVLVYRWGVRLDSRFGTRSIRRHLGRLVAMTFAIATIYLVSRFIDEGINFTGRPLFILNVVLGVLLSIAIGWLILLVLNAIGEAIIRMRALGPGNINAQLVRIVTRLLGAIALLYLAIHLAEFYGVPAAPLIASLGVGGLAIALAVRPTLENVIGGFILFADKPVRVGEFCRFGDKMGTIEQIGLRSTRIRGLDRTIITVPNADFAQLEIINFSERDQMMMRTTLGLRYETTPDQLRYVLAKLRELFIAHPRVSPDPARARFIGFGDFSLNIEIYVHVITREYNEYLAIAEDLNFRIMDIVAESGTGFAFPSQTAYLTRDTGLDSERAQAIEDEVQAWRGEDALPFPWPDADRAQALDGTLDYPPMGSTHYRQTRDDGQPAEGDADSPPESKARRRWGIMRPSPAGKR